MSTLKVNTVQHNTSGFNNVVQFTDGAGTENGTLCRAWVNFNGTGTVSIRASFNVSSITDNGTGEYTANFTNSMSDANYSVVGTSLYSPGSGAYQIITAITLNASSVYVANHTVTNSAQDNSVLLAIFR